MWERCREGEEYRLPYCLITSSQPFCVISRALCFLSLTRRTQPVFAREPLGLLQPLWNYKTQDCRLTTEHCKTDHISRGHLHISFHNAHTFLLNHVTASVYFPVVYTSASCLHSWHIQLLRVSMQEWGLPTLFIEKVLHSQPFCCVSKYNWYTAWFFVLGKKALLTKE